VVAKRVGCAITRSIRHACRWIGERTDRIDTERLLRSLMAYLRGEPKVWSVVRAPSIAEEDARPLHRECDGLVSERVQHVNRIKGLCALQDIYDYHPSRPQAVARLEQLLTAQAARYRRG
jgi:transposase